MRQIQRRSPLPDAGDAQVEVLWPPPANEASIREPNESSVVLRLAYAGYRILLCGDIMEQGQGRLIAEEDLKADVLVLPHHGSTTHDPRPFILAVDPRYCIRSGGNRVADVPNRLADVLANRVYLDCQTDGAIEVNIRRSGIEVRPWRSRGRLADPPTR